MRKMIPALLAALLLAACSSTPKTESGGAKIEDRTPGSGATTDGNDGKIQTITPDGATGSPLAILKDPKSILSKRSIYFDFDSYVIKAEHQALVEAHGKFLREHPELSDAMDSPKSAHPAPDQFPSGKGIPLDHAG